MDYKFVDTFEDADNPGRAWDVYEIDGELFAFSFKEGSSSRMTVMKDMDKDGSCFVFWGICLGETIEEGVKDFIKYEYGGE